MSVHTSSEFSALQRDTVCGFMGLSTLHWATQTKSQGINNLETAMFLHSRGLHVVCFPQKHK